MVPGWHEEFEALCALSTSGELTEDEWQRLHEHLETCASCRAAMADYERLASEVMPLLAASAGMELDAEEGSESFSLDDAERRLMDRFASEPPETADPPRPKWRTPLLFLIAASLCVAALSFRRVGLRPSTPAPRALHTGIVSTKPGSPQQFDAKVALLRELERANGEVVSLRKRLREHMTASAEAQARTADLMQKLEEEQVQLDRLSSERDALKEELASVQTEAQAHRDREVEVNAEEVQRAARVASLEERAQSLDAALLQKEHLLAQDQDLLAHDRDIRDLIGARNLYIAEIYDVAQTGATRKPFGRVFYTKDKSLVFYGYDLDQQRGVKEASVFQAWGRSGTSAQDVSLGLFYQDASDSKRWALKFNDASTLVRLDAVFVTVEPKGGSAKPTGKPLLFTYLRLDPNHP